MAKREEESDFRIEYSKYYTLLNKEENKIWCTKNEENICHFHTLEELKMLQDIEKNNRKWKVETHYYPSPKKI